MDCAVHPEETIQNHYGLLPDASEFQKLLDWGMRKMEPYLAVPEHGNLTPL